MPLEGHGELLRRRGGPADESRCSLVLPRSQGRREKDQRLRCLLAGCESRRLKSVTRQAAAVCRYRCGRDAHNGDMSSRTVVVIVVAALFAAAGCGGTKSSSSPTVVPTPGSGTEPGLAFVVSSDGRVTP